MKIPFEHDEYSGIPIYRMVNNRNGGLPIYIRRYKQHNITTVLHGHDSSQINYIAHGSLSHIINNSSHDLVKGDIFIIPPYVPHRLSFKENCDCEVIELEFTPEFVFGSSATMENIETIFDFAYIEPFLVSECDVRPRLNLTGKAQSDVEAMFKSILTEYTERNSSFLLAIKATILSLLVYVSRLFQEDIRDTESRQLFDRHRVAISNAINYINENFAEDISIEKVSRVAMLSQSYFSYLFKSMTNKTFVEYLNELRIQEAMKLLKHTNKRVVDICFESGFKNVNHFNRTFKNYAGISPMQYRNANTSK